MTVHGLYENREPGASDAIERLQEMREIGVTRVLNYWVWQGPDAARFAYADAADDLGMKLVWPSGATDAQIVSVADHPATWGYYIGEEPMTNPQQDQLNAYAAHLREVVPDCRRLFVDWGLISPSLVEGQLRPQKDLCEVIALDYYPVGLDGRSVANTGPVAAEVKRVAVKWGLKPAMVLQAFSWACEPNLAPPGNHVWPTRNQMRRMLDLTEAAGIERVWWFNYFFLKGPGCGDPDPSHVEDLRAVLAE